ncbi:hypothetical protein ACFV4M_02030 [Kitasatospora indigofera]|uniref:hypothetical protein n=1 Tax=Kitasatospora indigofera TaxID=67307 RepID=UPI00364D822A
MSDTQTPPEGHSALVAFAALTGLLAKYPQLSAAPVYWSFDSVDGIALTMRPKLATLAVFEGLADALGASADAGRVYEHGGHRLQPYYLHATLAGIPVFGSMHLPAEQDGAE